MLETILIILVVLWALGFFAFHVGGLVHVLLVIALVVLIVRLLQCRKILYPGNQKMIRAKIRRESVLSVPG